MNQLSKLGDISRGQNQSHAAVNKRGWYGDNEWWTAERIAELTRLWATGMSASEIARAMDTTKNAIVGKARRLVLPWRREAAAPLRPVDLAGLSHAECRFPFGDPKDDDFHFCGALAVPGKPYCAEHCARCYVKSSDKAAA